MNTTYFEVLKINEHQVVIRASRYKVEALGNKRG